MVVTTPMSNRWGVTVILIIRRQNLLTRRQNVIPVVDQRSLTPGPTAPRRSRRNPPRKRQNPRRPLRRTPIAVSPRTCVGSSALNSWRKRSKSANAGVLRSGCPTCWVYTCTSNRKGSSRRVLLLMTSRTTPITFGSCYTTTSLAKVYILSLTCWIQHHQVKVIWGCGDAVRCDHGKKQCLTLVCGGGVQGTSNERTHHTQ